MDDGHVTTMAPVKRTRKSHYITGIHLSVKCTTPIHYRSSWELAVCRFLDASDNVEAYAYEAVAIPYYYSAKNTKRPKMRLYYPDFCVKYTNGKKLLIEVKRSDKLNGVIVQCKAKAAVEWSKTNNYEYQFWTDSIIKSINSSPKQRSRQRKQQ